MSSTISCRPLRLHYFIRIPNVGDIINPLLVRSISGQETVFYTGPDLHLLASGSMMAACTPETVVWGSGVMSPIHGPGSPNARNICAVRGKLSYSALQEAGLALADMPMGDPGFLVPRLLGLGRSSAPRFRLGLVAHYTDRSRPEIRRLLEDPDVADLNVHDEPEQFLRSMADCECVASSSLHGLIFAEALGVPNLWVHAGDDVAGEGFKFRDWFSTTRRPQAAAHVLSASDTASSLARRAALHESAVNPEDLLAAFPTGRLQELQEAEERRLLPARICRQRPTPVFLISFNRGSMLRKVIESLRALHRPLEIIIHDNGSTDPFTLATLDELEAGGVRVNRRGPIHSADELNRVDESVQEFFSGWGEPARYVVSDCDVDMEIAAPGSFDVYNELLNAYRLVECVGPMLRIRDIPADYPLFGRVMNIHISHIWQHQPSWHETSFGRVAYLNFPIDTTLAMHRAGEPFRRLKSALRVYEPYEARHLDWYHQEIGRDVYSSTSSDQISHWNNDAERDAHQSQPLSVDHFFCVRRRPDGNLEVRRETLDRNKRIARTRALRLRGETDLERWSDRTAHQQGWQSRSHILANFVRGNERVFEFGAGESIVQDLLPPGCTYIGSDAAPLRDAVIPYDLNAAKLAPIASADVAFFSGVLEYVHDLERLLDHLSATFKAVVCSYATAAAKSPDDMEHRLNSGWLNDFTLVEFEALFQSRGFVRSHIAGWNGQSLFRWDLHQARE